MLVSSFHPRHSIRPRLDFRADEEGSSVGPITRFFAAIALVMLLAGCATPPPPSSADNCVSENYAPPHPGSLIVLIPVPAPKTFNKGLRQLEAQLGAQLKAHGYRVAAISQENYLRLWSQASDAAGGVFDPATGARRPQAFDAAMSNLARAVCLEAGCELVVRHRIVMRTARLNGEKATWDGVRQPMRAKYAHGGVYEFHGTTPALSVELIGWTARGKPAFRTYGGVSLMNDTNVRDSTAELRTDLFSDDSDVKNAVRLALAPIARPSKSQCGRRR